MAPSPLPPRPMPRNGTETAVQPALTPERLQTRLACLRLAVATLAGQPDRSVRGVLQVAGQLEGWLFRPQD